MTETETKPGSPTNGKAEYVDNKRLERYLDLLANEATSRSALFRRISSTIDPRRNIDTECGYPDTGKLTAKVYQDLYDREAVAARVVQMLPRETWKVQPEVYESEDKEELTEFEQALKDLLRGDDNYYQDQRGCALWEYLERADVLSGIGHFGVILLGIDDGLELREPAELAKKGQRNRPERKLIYVRVLPESLVQITQFESDPRSPRYGQPVMYSVTFNDPSEFHGGVGLTTATADVHWTRVVHVVDSPESSEVFHVPRMRPVVNNILNLRKMYGAAPEGYWRSCFTGLSFETNPQAGKVAVDIPGLRDQVEAYINGLDRTLLTENMQVKTLGVSVVDPRTQVDIQIEAICIKIPCPKRKFMGSERGELSSGQDAGEWDDTVVGRQNSVTTPRLVAPVINRLIQLCCLPEPEGFSVHWPPITKNDKEKEAKIAVLLMQALQAYVSGGVNAIVPEVDALTRILGWDEAEVLEMLERAAEQAEAKMEEDMAAQEERIARGLQPDPTGGLLGPQAEEPVDEPPPEEEPTDNWQSLLDHGGSRADLWRELQTNAFCPTGPGGGIKPTCSPKDAGSSVATEMAGSMSGTGGGTLGIASVGRLQDAVSQGEASLKGKDKSAFRAAFDKVASKLITVSTHLLTDAAKEVGDDIMLHVTFNKLAGMPMATTAWQAGAWGAAKAYLKARKAITGNELFEMEVNQLEAGQWQPI